MQAFCHRELEIQNLILTLVGGDVVIISVYAKSGTQYAHQRHTEEFLYHLTQIIEQFQDFP